jgi:hypothetical protein
MFGILILRPLNRNANENSSRKNGKYPKNVFRLRISLSSYKIHLTMVEFFSAINDAIFKLCVQIFSAEKRVEKVFIFQRYFFLYQLDLFYLRM